MPLGHATYLVILIGWVLPIVGVQWLVAGRALWRARRLILTTVLLCGTYLALADAVAIAKGIWQIAPEGTVGVVFGDHLPLEEALFYYLTALMSAQGFVMLAWHFAPKEGPQKEE